MTAATHNKGVTEVFANPAAKDAEMAALGAAMVEKWAAQKLLQMTKAEDFFDGFNRYIYEAIEAVIDKSPGLYVDITLVSEELRRKVVQREPIKTALDAIGGGKFLTACIDKVTSSSHVEHYARYVREASLERQIQGHLRLSAEDPSGENVKKLGDLILSLQGNRGAAIFDMRKDLGPMVDQILDKPLIGTPTGFADFDFHTNGGPQPEELITIGARPGAGKTAIMLKMACNMAESLAAEGNPKEECILYLTTEMTVKSLVTRILPMVTKIPHKKFRAGNLTKEDARKVLDVCDGGIDTYPLKIMGRSRLSMDDIKGAVYQAKPKVVFIDYLQRCKLSRAETQAQALTDFMAELKSFLIDCQIAGFIGCQTDRELDKFPDSAPTMAHLKGSGGIEAESDMVVMLWKPSGKVIKDRIERGIGWIEPRHDAIAIEGIIRKARSGESDVSFPLQLQGELIKMTDRVEYVPPAAPQQEYFG